MEKKSEFDLALQKALDSKKVAFIEVIVDRYEDVLPMVPSGGAIHEMILPKTQQKQD